MTQEVQQERAAEEARERLVIGSTAIEAESPPSSVVIAPWGEVQSAKGTFVMDERSAQLVIAAFKAHGTDIPIDYEHQSLGGAYASPSGQAPAAGWIKSLGFVSPEQAGAGEAGLVAEVAWTGPARDKLAAREYRYLSPVVLVRQSDRRVVALHSAALTNKPAIVGAKPIVNRLDGTEPVGEAGDEANGESSEVVERLRGRLGLSGDCRIGEVLVFAEQRLAAQAEDAAAAEADRRVAVAVSAGKLTSAQRGWARQLALKDPASFDAWEASAPQVVMLGRTRAPADIVCGGRDRQAVAAAARVDYRAEPALAALTSEAAWVAEALREAGLDGQTDAAVNVG